MAANTLHCAVCDRWVEERFSLPCHDQHKLCKECIGRQTVPGQAVKCHICRAVHGSVNIALLKVDGVKTLPLEQSCSPCRLRRQKLVKAEWYCADCDAGLCTESYETHEDSHNNKHRVVTFEEFRKKCGAVKIQRCPDPEHENLELKLWCKKCEQLACRLCPEDGCPRGYRHDFQPVAELKKKLQTEVRRNDRRLKDQRESALTCKKKTQDSMEALRLQYGEIDREINRVEGMKIQQIGDESRAMRDQAKHGLKQSAKVVENLCQEIDNAEEQLSKMIDGVNSLVEFNHPVDAWRLNKEMQVENYTRRQWVEPNHLPPSLEMEETVQSNLLGLRLDNVPQIPNPPINRSCF